MTSVHGTLASERRGQLAGLVPLAGAVVLVGGLVLVGKAVQDPSRVRLAVALAAIVFLTGLALRSPVAGIVALLLWLVALGMSRRLVSELAPITRTDPLLLVSPFILVVLVAAAERRGAFRDRTPLSNGVLALSLLALLEAVNPLQGSLASGLAGLLFVLVPMLAFWVGRAYLSDSALKALLGVVAGLGVVVAVYGLAQTWLGFPSWDRRWISGLGYTALTVNGVIRPFATFSSASEYGVFLAVAIVVWLTLGSRLAMLPITVAALAVLVPALVLESARGAIVGLIATIGLIVGAYRRLSFALAAGFAVLLLFALVFGVRHFGSTNQGSGNASALISHQVQGLSDPFNPQTSTLGAHLGELRTGLKEAFTQPAGQGVGSVTIAGSKFGGLVKGTEIDPSNAAVALGLPGLFAYLVVLVAGMLRLYDTAARRRDGLALAALGVVAVTAGQWLNGGQYAVAVLPWLVLGWVDRPGERPQERSGADDLLESQP
jgi:hypothetical protein